MNAPAKISELAAALEVVLADLVELLDLLLDASGLMLAAAIIAVAALAGQVVVADLVELLDGAGLCSSA